MRTIRIERDPYGTGITPTRPTKIDFEEGITVLIGCNGAGKTTLLNNINEELKRNNVPVYYYRGPDNDGNQYKELLEGGQMGMLTTLLSSSEGEKVGINVADKAPEISEFIKNGFVNNRAYRLRQILNDQESEPIESKERWILLDRIDSGCSVDMVEDLKFIITKTLEYAKEQDGIETYLIIAANNYEMASGLRCMNVKNGRTKVINSYEDYKEEVIKTRTAKEKQLARRTENPRTKKKRRR